QHILSKQSITNIAETDEEKLIQALSISFQLMNLVEQNAAVQFRRNLVNQQGSTAIRGSWSETLEKLKAIGLSQEQILSSLEKVTVMPVLTAHPTESKRLSVIDLHREFYLLLVKMENSIWSITERKMMVIEMKSLLERWWRTGEVYLEKPTVAAERNNVLHYFAKVFPLALQQADNQLKQSWESVGFNIGLLNNANCFPKWQFGSWVGGDRDGHPYVTAEITAETLQLHRKTAIEILIQQIHGLSAKLSFSATRNTIPNSLTKLIEEKIEFLGAEGKELVERNKLEPWRQLLNLIKLQLTYSLNAADNNKAYHSANELSADLNTLKESLIEINGQAIVSQLLFPLERQVQCFGLHLAKLDIRQNSTFHDKALEQMLQAEQPALTAFSTWDEQQKINFLTKELMSDRPFA
ncbi:MAG: phosphoenolpyruvate carboxylase, partial [Chitinophagaceae bacterium]